MLNSENVLEQEIYASVTGIINEHVNKTNGSDTIYGEAQKALALVYEEIMAQRFAALHFKQELLRKQNNATN